MNEMEALAQRVAEIPLSRRVGRIADAARGLLRVERLSDAARLGDRVVMAAGDRGGAGGEVVRVSKDAVTVLCDTPGDGIAVGAPVTLLGALDLHPDDSWTGRIVDAFGAPLDGRPIRQGRASRPLRAAPPDAAGRRKLGPRLATGLAVFDTMLPVVRGQRIGLFAGSGVGKSSLLAQLARGVEADVVVIALVGERGRELRHFTDVVLGTEGMRRSVVVAATADQSPLVRRRAAWTALAVAEHFRDRGAHVLFLIDSVTRFAQAHREIALASGENDSLKGYPPSVVHMIGSLVERAGPGTSDGGDITAVFNVLVPGADMDEPVADILRGTLDGHVVLDREIAERGRFPAIDLLRSVSRSLPDAASEEENALIARTRQLLGSYSRAELMIRAGLYVAGTDPLLDEAVKAWPALDAFTAETSPDGVAASFRRLAACVDSGSGGSEG